MTISRAALALLAALALAPPAAAQAPPADSLLARASASRVKGSADAPVTIIELSDFQCPFCREFAQTTLARLDSAYVQTGKVRIVFFNFPLPMHAAAWPASEAAMCAGAQDAFWPMHDRLFAEQAEWSRAAAPAEHFRRYAADLGLDVDAWLACTRDDRLAPLLANDLIQAAGSGASSTPTFILNGERLLAGVQPFEEFQKVIEELLNR